MAYLGPIQFTDMKIKFVWDDSVRLKENGAEEARLTLLELGSQDCHIKPIHTRCHCITCKRNKESREQELEGVHLGRKQKHFILLVMRDEAGEYARMGMRYVERGVDGFVNAIF